MTTANLFQTPIKDEYGNTFPQAQAAILVSEIIEGSTRRAEEVGAPYSKSKTIIGCTYNVQYYGNPQAKAQGFFTRTLRSFVDGGFTDVLEADMEHAESQSLLNSTLSDDDKIDRIIKADLIRKSK